MPNVLTAIRKLVEQSDINLRNSSLGKNRINAVGTSLENYIKDLFSGCNDLDSELDRTVKYNQAFSYLGNQNNPPDLIIKNGDAIEIKKIQGKGSSIALNSSYPKSKLYSESPMLTAHCRSCEEWKVKDLLYVIGQTDDTSIKDMWFLYGDCFCASKEVYERIKTTIEFGINSITDVEFTETNELGKVKKVDPLGITDLRIRGMWHILSPKKVFPYLDLTFENKSTNFQFYCLIRTDKYNSFPQEDRNFIESFNDGSLIKHIQIKNPDNPAQLVNCIFIKYSI